MRVGKKASERAHRADMKQAPECRQLWGLSYRRGTGVVRLGADGGHTPRRPRLTVIIGPSPGRIQSVPGKVVDFATKLDSGPEWHLVILAYTGFEVRTSDRSNFKV